MTNRIRHLLCGHQTARVEDYGDESYQWRLRCRTCGQVEHWSQAEWRQHLGAQQPGAQQLGAQHLGAQQLGAQQPGAVPTDWRAALLRVEEDGLAAPLGSPARGP